ncbi:MAG: nucleotidyltransferase domain-containing protein [Nanoarchaeota archaeon]
MLVQRCTLWKVAEIFFLEPTKIHFVKEISRKISLSPTSVRIHLSALIKEGLVKAAESEPFNGYRALRENQEFIFEKKIANLIFIKNSGLIEELKEMYPRSIILFGSYNKGEDIENSDIDLFIDSKPLKFNLYKVEDYIKRKIHLIFKEEANKSLIGSINQGTILFGER